jgi:hypothetical protein
MAPARLFLLDNSCLSRLQSPAILSRVRASIRASGKEFWPSAVNVLEAVKSRNRETRTRLLASLAELAGENQALPLPTEALRRIAVAIATGADEADWSEPGLTAFLRDPSSVTDEMASEIRTHLLEQEASFNRTHETASVKLHSEFRSAARLRWTSPEQFLDEVWSVPSHWSSYLHHLWEQWDLDGIAPVEDLLANDAWRLLIDVLGAATYVRHIEHPQRRLVQSSDLYQLVYLGSAPGRVLATEDIGFRSLANAILRKRYHLARVVSLDEVLR